MSFAPVTAQERGGEEESSREEELFGLGEKGKTEKYGKGAEFRRGSSNLLGSRLGYEVPFEDDGAVSFVRFDSSSDKRIRCLWDSGASFSYIDGRCLDRLGLKAQGLSRPRRLIMFDGTPSDAGAITHFIDLSVLIREDRKSKSIRFYVTLLADSDVVIGRAWMKLHGVRLDMEKGRVRVKEVRQGKASLDEVGEEGAVLRGLVGEAWRTHEDLGELKTMEAQFWEPPEERDLDEEERLLRTQVPEWAHDFLDLFRSKDGLESLPPHREYDMQIELVSNSRMRVAPLYQLHGDQLAACREIIDRESKAGKIRASHSSYGSAAFFVPKSNGAWRMVVDYRAINAMTVLDVYPLPLVNQIMFQVAGSKYFAKFDLVGAYQLLRMAEGNERYTAFRTPLGMFESLVVRDGLCNAPSVFQHFLNEVFRELLGRGVIVYIDDLLVYSETIEDLRRIVRRMFELARAAKLYFKASKCEFEVPALRFLGMVISDKGIESDPEKVKAITEFPRPKNATDVRSFLGLIGYYRRFIKGFSEASLALTRLTKKDQAFEWTETEEGTFESMKRMMCEGPVLRHYDPRALTILQTDASFFGWGFVISQVSIEDEQEHPIVIESGRFKGAQINYTTTEKEFLAIVEAFTRNRHILLPVETTVLTDHQNLRYWQTPRQLSPRQARWAELLNGFRMKIVYRPGKHAVMPDALSRRNDYHEGKGATELLEANVVQALPDESPMPEFLRAAVDVEEIWTGGPLDSLLRAVGNEEEIPVEDLGLPGHAEIRMAQLEDPELADLREGFTTVEELGRGSKAFDHLKGKARNQGWTLAKWAKDGLLSIDGLTYVSGRDMRGRVIKSRHDSPTAGHPGIEKTQELMGRDYTWIGMGRDIEEYVKGCLTCQRMKGSHGKRRGVLKTLEVPERPWQHLSMDFIDQLPKSQQFDSILVVVDRLTKWATFIPCDVRVTSAKLADLLVGKVFSEHGLPESIVSDRGSKFTSNFWRNVCERLGITQRLSTSYHPQTDGQTERVNQILEQYLRTFVNFRQDNWSQLLPQASLTYNNLEHSSIGMSPFYANFGYHPRWVETVGDVKDGENPAATTKVEDLVELHRLCSERIVEANRKYSKAFDKGRTEGIRFEVGDKVMLSTADLSNLQPSRKLSARWRGPYGVLEMVGTHAVRLDLPEGTRIHPVVNASRLKRFVEPSHGSQRWKEPDAVLMEDGTEEYEVKGIIDSRRRNGRLEYLVEWKGYEGTDEAVSWQESGDLIGSADESIAEFHRLNPTKPKISDPPKRKNRIGKGRRGTDI